MFPIISAVIGFVGSFIPNIIQYFKTKQDYQHEIEIMKLQMEAQKQLHTERLEEIRVQADIVESQALYRVSELKPSGARWADAFLYLYNGTVRPTVTYAFTILYALHKIATIKILLSVNNNIWNVLSQSYTEFDSSALMLVLSYWFGQRMASKVFKVEK